MKLQVKKTCRFYKEILFDASLRFVILTLKCLLYHFFLFDISSISVNLICSFLTMEIELFHFSIIVLLLNRSSHLSPTELNFVFNFLTSGLIIL